MSDHVYVQGVGMIKFGRFAERTVFELGADAALLALDDAGLSLDAIQALYCGNVYEANNMPGQKILRQIGQTGIEVVNASAACASGASAFRLGWAAIKAGIYDAVLVVGCEQMGAAGLLKPRNQGTPIPTEGVLGSGLMPAVFAELGVAYMTAHGATFEDFAMVSVKNHEHAIHNPLAMYNKPTPLEMVTSSEMIAWPNTKLMCSVNVDGAAAAVLVSEAKAKQLGMKRAIRVAGSSLRSDRYTERNLALPDINTCSKQAAQDAYKQSGVDPRELDVVELHDCFATAELLHYENLGLCGEGQAPKLLRDRVTWAGGRTPVNLSGGLLSKGHPLGATGVANIVEVTTQLRGEAGKRQREGAKVGLTHVVGFGSCAAVHVLTR
ncbi:MAG: thiolase family protein [Kofleriaceae bacterium]